MKKLLIFDLDGTLAESKCPLSIEVAGLLEEALKKYSIAVISGANYKQFQAQFLAYLPVLDEHLKNLYLFPTCATSFYRYIGTTWEKVYSQPLSVEEKEKIFSAFEFCFKEIGFVPNNTYGEVLEDRESQITFSALGQNAPPILKKNWDPNHLKRLAMIDLLRSELIDFEIRTGGSTSIDITHKDIDKAYGIAQIEKHLGFSINEMLFIGDQIDPCGNDFPIVKTGIDFITTSGPQETIKIINDILCGKFVLSAVNKIRN